MTMQNEGQPSPEELASFEAQFTALIGDMSEEALELIRELFNEMDALSYEEQNDYLDLLDKRIKRARLTPEAARAAVVAELEAGREPEGALLGDWLSVDPALQAFFRRTMQEVWKPDTVLHLAPQGFVLAA